MRGAPSRDHQISFHRFHWDIILQAFFSAKTYYACRLQNSYLCIETRPGKEPGASWIKSVILDAKLCVACTAFIKLFQSEPLKPSSAWIHIGHCIFVRLFFGLFYCYSAKLVFDYRAYFLGFALNSALYLAILAIWYLDKMYICGLNSLNAWWFINSLHKYKIKQKVQGVKKLKI